MHWAIARNAALFTEHPLDERCSLFEGELPERLRADTAAFERLWALHPPTFHRISIHGREVDTPRWQQTFGADYHYTGSVNVGLPVPIELEPLRRWARETIDERLSGILVNWYDAEHRHYIGKHRDSTTNLVRDAPIVTISFGSERPFRVRPWRGEGRRDFAARDGTLFLMPFETNLAFTHEVPHRTLDDAHRGRRISVTLRAFEEPPARGG